ncbi:hypothetical protein B0H19DRAFT_1148420 [Mycena capillaripes]|nr:hypothetical protein B0H19DRAFT_1148420 [Mycena capillaripes]
MQTRNPPNKTMAISRRRRSFGYRRSSVALLRLNLRALWFIATTARKDHDIKSIHGLRTRKAAAIATWESATCGQHDTYRTHLFSWLPLPFYHHLHAMDEAQSKAIRLNNEAKKLFDEGKFKAAGKLYEAAHKADTLDSPIYLSNLALVQLKLQDFVQAEISATKALMQDPRFCKARYRRALARQKQGRLMDSLIDLANVLTAEPMNKAAAAAFATIQREHEALGPDRDGLPGMPILMADFPSAYGSAAVAPRPVRDESPGGGIVIPNTSYRIPKDLRTATCASCKIARWTREIKTCRGYCTGVYGSNSPSRVTPANFEKLATEAKLRVTGTNLDNGPGALRGKPPLCSRLGTV